MKIIPPFDKRIYIPLSNVISAIIRLRHIHCQIELIDDIAVVSSLPLKCKYAKIFIYSNGSVKYMDRFGTIIHEGNAKSIGKLKKEILNWEARVKEENSSGEGLEESSSGQLTKGESEPLIDAGFFRK